MHVAPGDVVHVFSPYAGKNKYHLCIGNDHFFIFLSSPKTRSFAGDFEIDGSKITGVPPTPEGKSIASCNTVMQIAGSDLRRLGAQVVGKVTLGVMRDLLAFVQHLPTIAPETRDCIVEELMDFLG